jgi:electron transfer flavoprotein alpha/beta subunit
VKIAVLIKMIPDPYTVPSLAADGSLSADSDPEYVINPFDEVALEAAIRLSETCTEDAEITAVTVGPANCQKLLRRALAMGATTALLLQVPEFPSSAAAAALIAEALQEAPPDLIVAGKMGADRDQQQTHLRAAAFLAIPDVMGACSMEWSDERTLRIQRITPGGTETLHVALPALVTAELTLAEPRYVGLPAIVRAKSKQITLREVTSPSAPEEPQTVRAAISRSERKCTFAASAAELASWIKRELPQ